MIQTKVTVGRRVDQRIEISGGIDAESSVVVAGGVFLGDGDFVRVVEEAAAGQGKVASVSVPLSGSQQ